MSTPKEIAKKIKAKGLGQLKLYCELCEKQCRDENGFKCHQTGESHLRKMAEFRANSGKFQDSFSTQFENMWMDTMRRTGGCRVKANNVYQQVIQDRTHVHMTSTKWETLTSFVQYLGRTGLCKVDQDESGVWYVQYIDRDPRILARQEELAKRAETHLDAEQRQTMILNRQIEQAQKAEREAKRLNGETGGEEEMKQPSELKERSEEEKIVFSLGSAHSAAASSSNIAASSSAATPAAAAASSSSSSSSHHPAPAKPFSMSIKPTFGFNAFAAAAAASSSAAASSTAAASSSSSSSSITGTKRKGAPSTLDALMMENEKLKAHDAAVANKKAKLEAAAAGHSSSSSTTAAASSSSSSSTKLDNWIVPNIIVKILNKKLLNGALYKQKGVILQVFDKYLAEVRIESAQDSTIDQKLIKIDQDELETVIPSVGKLIQFVNGHYRGEIGVLMDLNPEKYAAKVRIESGVLRGKEVDGVEYEEICKRYEA